MTPAEQHIAKTGGALERASRPRNRAVLEAIAGRQRALMKCYARHIPGRYSDQSTYAVCNDLASCGLVKVHSYKSWENAYYSLTDAGWKFLGQERPIWQN